MFGKKKKQDEQLIRAIREGGGARESAVRQLLTGHIGFVHKVHRSVGIDLESAKDCFTDAVMAVVEQVEADSFRGDSKLSSYLYRILYNKSVDLLRRQTTNPVNYQEKVPERSDPAGLQEQIQHKDEVRRLHQHLDRLGDPCRQILLDWGYWGYSMKEIAQRAGLADAGKAKRRKYECLQQLLKMVRTADPSE